MRNSPSIYSALLASVAHTLKVEPKGITLTLRTEKILDHYVKQIDLGRMDIISATDRAIGDISGRNYHPKLNQRGGVHVSPHEGTITEGPQLRILKALEASQ